MVDSGETAEGRDRTRRVAAELEDYGDSTVVAADDLPVAGERLDGFISYARRPPDREFVDWLSRELANRGSTSGWIVPT